FTILNMNRRDSLKTLGIGAMSASALLAGCKPTAKEGAADNTTTDTIGRQDFEVARDKALMKEKFFDEHEMATITILANLIIPKDARSGNASDAGVPDFIEFIVK